MFSILRFELKVSLKQLLIWSLSVGVMGLGCIMLFKSMESSISEMAANYASMGAFSEAFGMDKLSIATIKGFFATEVGTIHSLGSAMFAAAIATTILSKEEDNHTAEFTFSLPVSRVKVIAMKYTSVVINLLVFALICAGLYELGFLYIGARDMGRDFAFFMLAQFMMNLEVASMCFLISAFCRKNKLGIGIAFAMVLYFFDLIARVVPDLEKAIILTPLSYANAADIFTGAENMGPAVLLGIVVTLLFIFASGGWYAKRDLAS